MLIWPSFQSNKIEPAAEFCASQSVTGLLCLYVTRSNVIGPRNTTPFRLAPISETTKTKSKEIFLVAFVPTNSYAATEITAVLGPGMQSI